MLFEDLLPGELFLYNDKIHLKLDQPKFNAVVWNTGQTRYIDLDEEVVPVAARLTEMENYETHYTC